MVQKIIEEIMKIIEPFTDKIVFNPIACTDQIEIYGDEPAKVNSQFILVRAFILEKYKQIHITNIFMHEIMRFKGIGKLIIRRIFEIASNYGYELFVVDMVPSFYSRLIARNASPCVESFDAVHITRDTDLS